MDTALSPRLCLQLHDRTIVLWNHAEVLLRCADADHAAGTEVHRLAGGNGRSPVFAQVSHVATCIASALDVHSMGMLGALKRSSTLSCTP